MPTQSLLKGHTQSMELYAVSSNLLLWLILPDRLNKTSKYSGQLNRNSRLIWFALYFFLTLLIATAAGGITGAANCQVAEDCYSNCKKNNGGTECAQGPTLTNDFDGSKAETYWYNSSYAKADDQKNCRRITNSPQVPYNKDDPWNLCFYNSDDDFQKSFDDFDNVKVANIHCVIPKQAPACQSEVQTSAAFLGALLTLLIMTPLSWISEKMLRFAHSEKGESILNGQLRKKVVYPFVVILALVSLVIVIIASAVDGFNFGTILGTAILSFIFDNIKGFLQAPLMWKLWYNRKKKPVTIRYMDVYPDFTFKLKPLGKFDQSVLDQKLADTTVEDASPVEPTSAEKPTPDNQNTNEIIAPSTQPTQDIPGGDDSA